MASHERQKSSGRVTAQSQSRQRNSSPVKNLEESVSDFGFPYVVDSDIQEEHLETGIVAPSADGTIRQPLQFILLDDPFQGQTADQRREVRAHAMREYHKSKKKRTIPSKPTVILQKPCREESTNHQGTSVSTRSFDPSLKSRRPISVTQESGSSPDLGYGRDSSSTSEYASISSSGSLNKSGPTSGDASRRMQVKERGRSRFGSSSSELYGYPNGLPGFDRWQYDTNTPYALCMGSGAPTLYMQARRWPFVRHACGASPGISLWMPEITIPLPSAYAQRPCLLRDTKTVPWIGKSLEYLEFKGETVKWINARLEDHQLATNNATIGVIMCLANWEIARCNREELEQHMNGLRMIVQLRGGIDALVMVRHFQIKISLVDLLVAALNNTLPRFPPFFIPQPYRPPPHIQGLSKSPVTDSPLCGSERLDGVLTGSPFGEIGIKLLQRMKELTNMILESTTERVQGRYILNDDEIHNTTQLYWKAESPLTESDTNNLLPQLILTPVIHAATIYERAISTFLFSSSAANRSQTHFSSPLNHQSLELLVQSLQLPTHDATFAQYPGILVWILLVSVVAAEGREERGFLVMMLTRVGTGSGYGWWSEMREAVETFRAVRGIVG